MPKKDKTIIKVGEGADVDLTVKDSNLTTGGNGIDIGVNLKDDDDNKETNVDLTLDNTKNQSDGKCHSGRQRTG